jgi:hypothetical protein
LPFPLLGIDSDNGSEFTNDQLYRYCLQEQITFTRGRAGNKNDSAFAEQKNWSIVRRAVGLYRYDTPVQLDLLNRLYAVMHYYVNFFIPVMKLVGKSRVGSKIIKTYDKPRTPYARVLDSPDVSDDDKAQLREIYEVLDLAHLRLTKSTTYRASYLPHCPFCDQEPCHLHLSAVSVTSIREATNTFR